MVQERLSKTLIKENIMALVNSLMATLHHLSAFTLTACLVYEFIAFSKVLTVEEARRIQRVDLWYGISAGLLVAVGLLRVFFFEKGAPFYAANLMFWIKMALFVIVGLLSIYPTIRYIKWNSILAENKSPVIPDAEYKNIRLLLLLEMIGLVLILFAAPAMARAILML
jgi:putative membrane protein